MTSTGAGPMARPHSAATRRHLLRTCAYTTGELWWPPPRPNLALQYLAIMPPDPFIASEARTTSRNATAACYNQRQIADAEQRQREREERGQAEAKAAAEADRAAWGAKHGWPT
jgi:hypothetical protein